MGVIRRRNKFWLADYVRKGIRYRDTFSSLTSAELRLRSRDERCPQSILKKAFTEAQYSNYLEDCRVLGIRKRGKTKGREKYKETMTKSGKIYFVALKNTNYMKIGFSRNLKSRLQGLQNGLPEDIVVVCEFEGNMLFEKLLHKQFKKYCTRGEWYVDSDGVINQYVDTVKVQKGGNHECLKTIAA